MFKVSVKRKCQVLLADLLEEFEENNLVDLKDGSKVLYKVADIFFKN